MIESKLIQTSICEIRKKLDKFAACPKTQEKLDDGRYRYEYHTGTYWTPSVMSRICCVGKKLGFDVYKDWYNGKRLYDLFWVDEHDRLSKSLPLTKRSLPLALECEWDNYGNIKKYRREIEYDFKKLLRSCAALRVMIFECWCPKEHVNTVKRKAEKEINNLTCHVKTSSDSQSEAIYLFCVHCTYEGGNKFIFHCYSTTES